MELNSAEIATANEAEKLQTPIRILFATATGNSEVLAEETAEVLGEKGWPVNLSGTDEFNPAELNCTKTLLLLISTDMDGYPPVMADDLYEFLDKKETADLGHLNFSVLALGDSYYPDFCQAGKDFCRMVEESGAHRLMERVDCDIAFWDDFDNWLDDIQQKLIEIEQKH